MSETQTLEYSGQPSTGMAENRKAVAAGVIGHILEWYDFAVYGYLALHIAANFFPSHDHTASLLASLGTFGIGFVARPLGGVIFGRIGDRCGRKAVLMWTLMLMGAATLAIGLVPTYGDIGQAAPILLVIARLVQGFSAGGETTAAAAFIVEWAPSNRRGLFGSFQQVGSAAGLLLGTLVVATLTSFLEPVTMAGWGWRIPFLIGIALAPVGYIIRSGVEETPVFKQQQDVVEIKNQTTSSFNGMVFQAFLFSLFWSVGFYFFLSYMPTFAQRELSINAGKVYWVCAAGTLIYMVAIPIFGLLSDKIGRKPVLFLSCSAFTVGLLPLFVAFSASPTPSFLLLVVASCAIMLAAYTGPAAATLSEFFPTRSRSTGMAVGYSFGTVIFGGFTPFISTWLIAIFHTPLAPIYYVTACAAIGGIFVFSMRETSRDELR